MKAALQKNESPVSAGQFVKTLSKVATDFIASAARYTSANTEFCVMFVALVWSVLNRFGEAI